VLHIVVDTTYTPKAVIRRVTAPSADTNTV